MTDERDRSPLPNPLPQAGEGAKVMPKPINEIVRIL